MQQDKRQSDAGVNNSAVVVGKIATEFHFSHEVFGEGFYQFAIEAPRLSEVSDLLPVTVSERIVDRNSLPVGTVVRISGQIRSYNNFQETDKRNKLVLTLFVRELAVIEEDGLLNPNEICLCGYVCKPPVFRMTPFGREISDILLAVNRSYNKSDYIPCIAWGRNARFGGKLSVGDHVRIWGRMQSRQYQKKYDDGRIEDKTAYEVSIAKIEYAVDSGEDESKDAPDHEQSTKG